MTRPRWMQRCTSWRQIDGLFYKVAFIACLIALFWFIIIQANDRLPGGLFS